MSVPPPPTTTGSSARQGPRRALTVVLWAITAAVLVQAALAGLFLSGTASTRLAHTIVGWLLPYAAIVVAVLAAICHVRGACAPRLAIATYPLPILLWVQEMLGHVPAAVTTAVHVPLGVVLALYPAVIAVALSGSGSRGVQGPRP